VLWQANYSAPAAPSQGPFTVRLTDAGELQVLSRGCEVLFSTPQRPSTTQRPGVGTSPLAAASAAPPAPRSKKLPRPQKEQRASHQPPRASSSIELPLGFGTKLPPAASSAAATADLPLGFGTKLPAAASSSVFQLLPGFGAKPPALQSISTKSQPPAAVQRSPQSTPQAKAKNPPRAGKTAPDTSTAPMTILPSTKTPPHRAPLSTLRPPAEQANESPSNAWATAGPPRAVQLGGPVLPDTSGWSAGGQGKAGASQPPPASSVVASDAAPKGTELPAPRQVLPGGFGAAGSLLAAGRCTPERSVAPAGTICGGVNLCGLDAVCAAAPCCKPGLSCARHSAYSWTCS
jgi:hypothetical protein